MKLKHTQSKKANRNFDKNITNPKGWHPEMIRQHFSPKLNSKTQQLRIQQKVA